MRRRLRNIASVVSALLCVATMAMWARSWWRVDSLRFGFSPLRVAGLYSGRGTVCVEFFGSPDRAVQWERFRDRSLDVGPPKIGAPCAVEAASSPTPATITAKLGRGTPAFERQSDPRAWAVRV